MRDRICACLRMLRARLSIRVFACCGCGARVCARFRMLCARLRRCGMFSIRNVDPRRGSCPARAARACARASAMRARARARTRARHAPQGEFPGGRRHLLAYACSLFACSRNALAVCLFTKGACNLFVHARRVLAVCLCVRERATRTPRRTGRQERLQSICALSHK